MKQKNLKFISIFVKKLVVYFIQMKRNNSKMLILFKERKENSWQYRIDMHLYYLWILNFIFFNAARLEKGTQIVVHWTSSCLFVLLVNQKRVCFFRKLPFKLFSSKNEISALGSVNVHDWRGQSVYDTQEDINTYTSAFCTHTTAQANLCNSPPDSSSTFRSSTCSSSNSLQYRALLSESSFFSSNMVTFPYGIELQTKVVNKISGCSRHQGNLLWIESMP